MIAFGRYLEFIGVTILIPIGDNNKFKLIFVMILFPIFVNSLQFWITDNIIKSNKPIQEQSNNRSFYLNDDGQNTKENSILHEIEENLNKTINNYQTK